MLNVKSEGIVNVDKGCELGDKVLWEWRKSSTFVVGIGSQRPRHPVTCKVAAIPPLPNG